MRNNIYAKVWVYFYEYICIYKLTHMWRSYVYIDLWNLLCINDEVYSEKYDWI